MTALDDNFPPNMGVNEAAKKIQSMEIRGAGRIARAAATAIRNALSNAEFSDIDDLERSVKGWCRTLYNTRPTAVSLSNALRYVLVALDNGGEDIDGLRHAIIKRCDDFIHRSLNAVKTIGEIGSHRIRDGMTLLTHCNSSCALSVIHTAHKNGRKIRVYNTESRPRYQGHITARTLASSGVDVTLIVDSAVRTVMRKVDLVIIGADTITANGAVINKIGTSQVALCAHEARVPVVVAAETYKFSPETLFGYLIEIEEREASEVLDLEAFPGVKVFNPAFDATPHEYIDAIITEAGIISPASAYDIIVEYYGKARPMNEILLP